jgi:tetratricopeptide (TPR) repeat protein
MEESGNIETSIENQEEQSRNVFGPEQIIQMNENLLDKAITLFLSKNYDKRLLPVKAKHHRSWWEVDSKTRMHARFCLPLTMASGMGFYILSPATFTVEWDGNDKHDAEIEIIDACSHAVIDNHSSYGSFTVQSSFIPRTKQLGDFVYIKGIANSSQLPYVVLEAMIESWWSPSEFGIVCLLNQPGKFKIKKGDPLAQMIVVNSEQAFYELAVTDGYPPIYPEWKVKQDNPERNLDYFRGRLPDGTPVCPHFKSWANAVTLTKTDENLSVDDFINAGVEAQENKNHEVAQSNFEQALQLAEARNEVSERLIDVMRIFAENRMADFKYELALKFLLKCVALNQRYFDSKLVSTADLFNHLASTYSMMDDAVAASTHYENSLRVKRETKTDALDLAATLVDYGALCSFEGKYDRATELFDEADSLLSNELPPEDPRNLFLKNATAILLTNQAKYEQAAKLYEELIETRSRQFGADSAEVASTLNDFAFHYKLRREFEKAEDLFKKCLAIRIERLGSEHLHVAEAHEHLFWVYRDTGNLPKAVDSLKDGLHVRLKSLPPNDQTVKDAYQLLADVYIALGETELANDALLNAKR